MSAVRINLSELRQFVSRVQSRSRTIRSEINRLRAAFQSVLDSEALQGAIKQAIDDNITQFHFPIINGLEELHHVLDDTVAKVVSDIQRHIPEDTSNGILQTLALESYRREVENNDQDVMDMNRRYRSIYNSMSDLMSFQTINTRNYDQALQGLKNELNRVLGQMDSFSADVGELEHLLGRVGTEINRVSSQVTRLPFQDRGPMVNPGFGNEMNRLHASRQKLLASRSSGFSGPISKFGAKFGFMGFGARGEWMRGLRGPDFKAALKAQREARINEWVASFFDEDGKVDPRRVAVALFNRGGNGEFSAIEWEALMRLLRDPRVSLQDMLEIYAYATINPTGNARATLRKLVNEFINQLELETVAAIWGMPHLEYDEGRALENELHDFLRRVQLLVFLESLGYGVIMPRDFDLSEWENRRGSIVFTTRPPFLIGRETNGFFTPTVDALFGRNFTDEMASFFNRDRLNRAIQEIADWWEVALAAGDGMLSNVPVVEHLFNTRDGLEFIELFLEAVGREGAISQEQAVFNTWIAVFASVRLGEAVSVMDTPNGPVVMFIEDTPRSLINMAGLEDLGFTPAEIRAVLMDEHHADFQTMMNFMNPPSNDYRLADFEITLQDIRDLHFEAYQHTPLEHLPQDVLREVLRLGGEGA